MVTGVLRWHAASPRVASDPQPVAALHRRSNVISDSALEEAEGLAVTNDPFRLSNSPPETRFDPSSDGSVRAFAPAPVRPVFALKAIVGGPPWQAVIDGIPGQPAGTVARMGDRYDKLVVRFVTRDSVVIKGPDTSWVLLFGRRP